MNAFPLSRPARIAVFASGRGSNLQSIIDAFPVGHDLATVALVISNKENAGALKKAAAGHIPARYIPFGRDREAFEREAITEIEAAGIDLICLAGFMRVLSASFVKRFAGRIINIHPSLLPAFPGLDAQGQALRAGVTESGCTVHFVDAGVDSGPVILQRSVPVYPEDDAELLAARILQEEHVAYPQAIRDVLTAKVSFAQAAEVTK